MAKKKVAKRIVKRVRRVKKRRIHLTSGSGLIIAIGIVVTLLVIILTKLALI